MNYISRGLHVNLRVRHKITATIGQNDWGVSQGAKFANTGNMEAMSETGAAQKRPGLRVGPSLARCVVAPRSHSPAIRPRRPRPNHKSGAPNCTGYFVTDPNRNQ